MTVRYWAGADYLVVGPSGGCLTPDYSAAKRVWPLIRDGEPLAAWLAELLTDGLASLADFVLVEFEGSGLRAILRGPRDLTVDRADGSAETCSGLTFSTWVERVFPAVTGGRAGPIAKPDLPLLLGMVQAGGFSFDSTGATSAGQAAGPGPAALALRPLRIVPTQPDLPEASTGSWAGPTAEALSPPPAGPSEEPAPASRVSGDREDAPLQPLRAPESLGETRSEMAEPLFGHVFESTILRKEHTNPAPEEQSNPAARAGELISQVPSARRAGVPETMAQEHSADVDRQLGDHDGSTIMAGQLAALRATVPVVESTEPSNPPPPAVLVLSDGSRFQLDRAVILGRRPQVDRVSSAELPDLVTVLSPNKDISRNHLQVRPSGATLLAADLHATNGTLLRRVDGTVVEITDGAEVPIGVGDRLELGDGVVARIEAG